MAMTFTLVSHLREQLSELIKSRIEKRKLEEAEKARRELEVVGNYYVVLLKFVCNFGACMRRLTIGATERRFWQSPFIDAVFNLNLHFLVERPATFSMSVTLLRQVFARSQPLLCHRAAQAAAVRFNSTSSQDAEGIAWGRIVTEGKPNEQSHARNSLENLWKTKHIEFMAMLRKEPGTVYSGTASFVQHCIRDGC